MRTAALTLMAVSACAGGTEASPDAAEEPNLPIHGSGLFQTPGPMNMGAMVNGAMSIVGQ